MGFCLVSLKGVSGAPLLRAGTEHKARQLPDPNAKSFTFHALKDAMLATIATINKFHEDDGITEASLSWIDHTICMLTSLAWAPSQVS